MSDTNSDPSGTSAQASQPSPSEALVQSLAAGLREQIQRSLEFEIGDEASSLAFIDHYLSMLREEDRPPIVALVAAQAGAWFGELVRREFGAQWIGDGEEPRRLRILLEPAFVHFSPVDMAYEAIFSGPAELTDPRLPPGAELDGAYHLRKRPDEAAPSDSTEIPAEGASPTPAQSEHDWVMERLAETPPMPEDQYYSLTGRFETLQLIVQLLATRRSAQGREPTLYHLNDYVAELTES